MPEPETAANTNGSTPSSPASAPTSGAEPWKAGAHSRFAGRSPEEILGIAEALASVAERFNQPVPQPVEQPRNRFDFDIPDDQYVDGRQVKQILTQFANQPAPVDYIARQQAIAQAIYTLKRDHAADFQKWGSEIQAEWNKLPQEYWNVDTLGQLIRIVRSNHVDEIAAEKAQRLRDESHPTIRSGSGGSGSVPNTQSNVFETGPQDLLARARQVGISNEAELHAACKELGGVTPEQYVAELEKYGRSAIVRG